MWWPKKKYSELSTMEDISQQLKHDPSSRILRFKRGFIYLKRKNFEKAIEDFNTVISNNNYLESCPNFNPSPYFKKIYLYQTYLFRSLAYALLGHRYKPLGGVIGDDFFAKSINDYKFFVSKKNKKNYDYEYIHLILFSWCVLNNETEKAINNYSKIRKYSTELMDFEEDIFNLLPIENIEGLYESIKLIDFTLGIVKKKGN